MLQRVLLIFWLKKNPKTSTISKKHINTSTYNKGVKMLMSAKRRKHTTNMLKTTKMLKDLIIYN